MNRTPYSPGWYGMGTVLNSGHAVLVPNHPDMPGHVDTHVGHLSLPPGGNALFLVCTYWKGVFVMACQGEDDGGCWVWNGTKWVSAGPTVGTSPCAFGPLGLYIQRPHEQNLLVVDPITNSDVMTGTMAIGARGFAYIDPVSGQIWSVDACYGQHGLAEFVPVRPDLFIGQGLSGGTQINYRGTFYQLEAGDVQFHRVEVIDDHLAVAMWKKDEASCVVHWFTEGEIPSLPKVGAPVPEPPVEKPPVPEPPKPVPVPPKPVPPPVETFPPLKSTQRYWLGPNIDSDVPGACHADLATVDVFGIAVQWILEDARYAQLDTLKAIRAQGVNFAIEMGSIKPGDYHAEGAQAALPTIAQRVLAKGHKVCYLVMDEPLTATYQTYDANGKLITLDTPVQPLEESAFAIAKFVERARAEMPGVKVCWAEAWPQIPLETMRKCLMTLDSWGCRLDGWHLDVDWHEAKKRSLNPYDMITLAKSYADDYKAPLGVYLAGYPHATDTDYYNEVVVMAEDLHAEAAWAIDHVLIESWAVRLGTGKQDLPANLGEHGLFPLFGYVQETIFT